MYACRSADRPTKVRASRSVHCWLLPFRRPDGHLAARTELQLRGEAAWIDHALAVQFNQNASLAKLLRVLLRKEEQEGEEGQSGRINYAFIFRYTIDNCLRTTITSRTMPVRPRILHCLRPEEEEAGTASSPRCRTLRRPGATTSPSTPSSRRTGTARWWSRPQQRKVRETESFRSPLLSVLKVK